ncbi:unnamed protein product, partial [Meganyctiphanes norvegica]
GQDVNDLNDGNYRSNTPEMDPLLDNPDIERIQEIKHLNKGEYKYNISENDDSIESSKVTRVKTKIPLNYENCSSNNTEMNHLSGSKEKSRNVPIASSNTFVDEPK